MKHKLTAATLAISASLAFAPTADANVIPNFTPDDYPLAAEFTAVVQEVVAEHPEIGSATISAQPLGITTYAIASKGRIIFNKQWTTNPVGFAEHVNFDISQGFHPAGCSPARTLALHEAAHLIDTADGLQASWVVVAQYPNGGRELQGQLSGYSFGNGGYLNPPEALAEAYVAVKCEGAGASQAERDLYNILVTA